MLHWRSTLLHPAKQAERPNLERDNRLNIHLRTYASCYNQNIQNPPCITDSLKEKELESFSKSVISHDIAWLLHSLIHTALFTGSNNGTRSASSSSHHLLVFYPSHYLCKIYYKKSNEANREILVRISKCGSRLQDAHVWSKCTTFMYTYIL